MNKPLHIITRKHHLEHLMRILPYVAIVFTAQCLLMRSLINDQAIGNLCFMMGNILIMMVGCIYYYDVNHSVSIYSNHIVADFPPFFRQKVISFGDIDSIEVADDEMEFSNMKIHLKAGGNLTLLFVDNPLEVQQLIKGQMFEFDSAA